MTTNPNSNDGAINKAATDAAVGLKADTQTWNAPLREAYDAAHAAQTKKSSTST